MLVIGRVSCSKRFGLVSTYQKGGGANTYPTYVGQLLF